MSTTECSTDANFAARLYPVARFDGRALWIIDATGCLRRIAVSIRFSAAQVRAWVDQQAQILVVPMAQKTQADGAMDSTSAYFGVGIDFVGGPHAAPSRAVLCVDEICLGDGAARIFWDTDALHIAAENIDSQARFVHRITGGSIKIG